MQKGVRVLFMGIHPDDVELGCGGTAALVGKNAENVIIADLSLGESSSNGTVDERKLEAKAAAEILGVTSRLNLELPDTGIQAENREQLEKTVEVIRKTSPDVVFIPWKEDPHPDHASGGRLLERALYYAAMEGFHAGSRACKPALTLIYMGRLDFSPDLIVDVTGTHEVKMKAIRAHRSQFIAGGGRKNTVLNSPDFLSFLEARSRSFGVKVSAGYGEPFKLLRPMSVRDLIILSRIFQAPETTGVDGRG